MGRVTGPPPRRGRPAAPGERPTGRSAPPDLRAYPPDGWLGRMNLSAQRRPAAGRGPAAASAVVTAVVTAAALAAGLAACGGEDPAPEPTPPALIGPGSDIINDVAARQDITVASCTPDDEEGTSWTVVAEATNSTEEPVVYQIAVRFASPTDGSVLGREAHTTVPVEPGESVTFEVSSVLEEAATELNCILPAISREAA